MRADADILIFYSYVGLSAVLAVGGLVLGFRAISTVKRRCNSVRTHLLSGDINKSEAAIAWLRCCLLPTPAQCILWLTIVRSYCERCLGPAFSQRSFTAVMWCAIAYPFACAGVVWMVTGGQLPGLMGWWPPYAELLYRLYPAVLMLTAILFYTQSQKNHWAVYFPLRLISSGLFFSWILAVFPLNIWVNERLGGGFLVIMPILVAIFASKMIMSVASGMVLSIASVLWVVFWGDHAYSGILNTRASFFPFADIMMVMIYIFPFWLLFSFVIAVLIRRAYNNAETDDAETGPAKYKQLWLLWFLLVVSYCVIGVNAGSYGWLPSLGSGIIIFMVILPLCNALFDWLAIGVAQRLLQRAVADDPARLWHQLRRHGLCAAGLMLGSAAAMAVMLLLLNGIAIAGRGTTQFDLLEVWRHLLQAPWAAENWWLYLMLSTTLLPVIAHAVIVTVSVFTWPGKARMQQMAGWLDHRLTTGHFAPDADIDALARYLSWGQYIPWIVFGILGLIAGVLFTFAVFSLPWLAMTVAAVLL